MRYVVCTAIALICTNLRGQSPPARPQFEVASVKPAANDETGGRRHSDDAEDDAKPAVARHDSDGRTRAVSAWRNWALLDLIAAAYSVRATQVSGPAWLSDQGFDIEAKLPDGTPKEELNAMLQSLLEERFGLKAHRDTQTRQGFALVVGKNGPKLKPAEPPPAPAQELTEEEQRAKTKEQAEALLAAMKKRMQENREDGTPLGDSASRSWSLDHHRRIGFPAGAIRRSACGRRDRFDRKIFRHHRDLEECRRSGRYGFRCCRKTRPETGAAQGDGRNRGG